MSAVTKLMTPGGGGVALTPASSIASDVTVNVPSQNCTLGIQGPAFSATKTSAGQSITSGVWTKITFDTEEFDTNSNFSSSRFTPTVAGYYQINGCSYLTSGVAASNNYISVYKNGVLFKYSSGFSVSVTTAIPNVSVLVYLNGSTDYVELYAFIGGASATIVQDSTLTFFQGALVRAA